MPPADPPSGDAPAARQPPLPPAVPAPEAEPAARCVGCGAPLPPDRDAFCEACCEATWFSETPEGAAAP